jgi:glutathione S-transferase
MDVMLGSLVSWVYIGEKSMVLGSSTLRGARLLNAWLERFGALDAAKAVLPVGKVLNYH